MEEVYKGWFMMRIGVSWWMFFWHQLTWIIPDKIQRAVKWLCVCKCSFWCQANSIKEVKANTLTVVSVLIVTFVIISIIGSIGSNYCGHCICHSIDDYLRELLIIFLGQDSSNKSFSAKQEFDVYKTWTTWVRILLVFILF